MWIWVILIWLAASSCLLFSIRGRLRAAWREPVLTHPVLIVESDDWGTGPLDQARALVDIVQTLSSFQDSAGRRPVFTLGLILANADGNAAPGHYHPVTLADDRFQSIREAIGHGRVAGVLSLQLHGMEHFWPAHLIEAAQRDAAVAAWLQDAPEAATEDLPPPLQSRWVDTSVLPSRPLDTVQVRAAAEGEAACFASLFGTPPRVAVPPTFIWHETVEQAWYSAGVRTLVTPGQQYTGRDAQGRPSANGRVIRTGDHSRDGLLYLVRNNYFEPCKGHRAERALVALADNTRLGRPTLLETHRINFIDPTQRAIALAELTSLYRQALDNYPEIAFISTEALAQALSANDTRWIEQGIRNRLRPVVRRLLMDSRCRKVLWATGLILPLQLAMQCGNRESLAGTSLPEEIQP